MRNRHVVAVLTVGLIAGCSSSSRDALTSIGAPATNTPGVPASVPVSPADTPQAAAATATAVTATTVTPATVPSAGATGGSGLPIAGKATDATAATTCDSALSTMAIRDAVDDQRLQIVGPDIGGDGINMFCYWQLDDG